MVAVGQGHGLAFSPTAGQGREQAGAGSPCHVAEAWAAAPCLHYHGSALAGHLYLGLQWCLWAVVVCGHGFPAGLVA